MEDVKPGFDERLAQHQRTVCDLIRQGQGFGFPSEAELVEECQFLNGEDLDLGAAVTAEKKYIECLQALIELRSEADQLWVSAGIEPSEFAHRQGGLAELDGLLLLSDGSPSDEYLLRASTISVPAAILYAMRRVVYGLLSMDDEHREWWEGKSNEHRLEQVMDLLEAFCREHPEDYRQLLIPDGRLLPAVIAALQGEALVVALSRALALEKD